MGRRGERRHRRSEPAQEAVRGTRHEADRTQHPGKRAERLHEPARRTGKPPHGRRLRGTLAGGIRALRQAFRGGLHHQEGPHAEPVQRAAEAGGATLGAACGKYREDNAPAAAGTKRRCRVRYLRTGICNRLPRFSRTATRARRPQEGGQGTAPGPQVRQHLGPRGKEEHRGRGQGQFHHGDARRKLQHGPPGLGVGRIRRPAQVRLAELRIARHKHPHIRWRFHEQQGASRAGKRERGRPQHARDRQEPREQHREALPERGERRHAVEGGNTPGGSRERGAPGGRGAT